MEANNINPKGFTLIELLVVIAIIGVLASIVLNSLQIFRTKGRDAKRQGDLHAITSAMAACYDDEACGGDPSQKDYWTCPATTSLDATAPCDGTRGGTATGWNFAIGPHLSEMPRELRKFSIYMDQ